MTYKSIFISILLVFVTSSYNYNVSYIKVKRLSESNKPSPIVVFYPENSSVDELFGEEEKEAIYVINRFCISDSHYKKLFLFMNANAATDDKAIAFEPIEVSMVKDDQLVMKKRLSITEASIYLNLIYKSFSTHDRIYISESLRNVFYPHKIVE